MLKKRDDFEDILEERRNSSDLRYALRCYTPVLYKELTPCTASELKSLVLQSDQLQYVISQVRIFLVSPTGRFFGLICGQMVTLRCLQVI